MTKQRLMLGKRLRLLFRLGLVVSLVNDDPQPFQGGGTSAASTFASIRSILEALGFIGARPLARSVCPVASNPVDNVIHAALELL